MSKKNKIVIGICTVGVLALILVILGIIVYKNKEVDSIEMGKNNTNLIQEENTIKEDNIIENVELSNEAMENAEQKEKDTDNTTNNETVKQQSNQESSTQISTKKESNKETTTKTQGSTGQSNTSQSTTNKESSSVKTNEDTKKDKTQTTSQENNSSSNNGYTEKKVEIAPKQECVGNNHKMSSGNTGKWFDTKAQADNYYNTEIEKWGKMWENDEITKEEYLKKCPSGYEVWTCPQCQKWTVNFYYR